MIAGVLLVVLLVCAGTADRTGLLGVVVLALVSVAWLLLNSSMAGDILMTVSQGHGLHAADLVGLAGLGLAGWRWAAWRQRGAA